jgi:hypothetical protein
MPKLTHTATVPTLEQIALKDTFLETARWRREKAVEYPHDDGNALAVKLLEQLAASADQVEPELLDAYAELVDDFRDGETHSELLRNIGFRWAPATAREFVVEFISLATTGMSARSLGGESE